MKKAIARTIVAIQKRSRSIPKTMINIAPIKKSSPVIENKPTFDLAESSLSERLKRKSCNYCVYPRIAIITIAATMKGITSLKPLLLLFGGIPENDEMVN